MKIVNLALANIRRGKSAAISLFILIFIATLLLNIGMMIIFKINSFYDDKVEELHGAHVSMIINSADYKQSKMDYFKSYSGVSETETEKLILMSAATFSYNGSDMNISTALLNMDTNRSIAPLKLIEKLDVLSNDAIYIPYSFKLSGGYKLGDTFRITFQDKNYNYHVAGFFEATMLSMNNMGMFKFYLPADAYRQLSDKLGELTNGTMISAILTDSTKAPRLLDDYNKHFPQPNETMSPPFYWSADIEMEKAASMITINFVAMIMVAFAAVIVLVTLIVIKFRASNSIDDGIVNIGVLKAVGYTSRQILTSITLQFMIITLSAGILGAVFSYVVMPVFGGIITTLSGLLWVQSWGLTINLESILIVSLLVLAVTMLSSRRIRNIHPVAALRGGLMTHSFKKNAFPLESAKGGLHFVLACKTMIMNSRMNIMIGFIIAAITFASVFSIVLYYNVATDKTSFFHLVGAETSNIVVQAKSSGDAKKLFPIIEQLEGVERVAILDFVKAKVDGQSISTTISDNYNKLENNTVYEGRNPQYDNEIAISWPVSKLIDKRIGDTVKVEIGDAVNSYLVTGLSQTINNSGQIAALTLAGVQHLVPDYTGMTMNVYLSGINNAGFIQAIKASYGEMTADIVDVDEALISSGSIYISAVFAVMVIILAITVLIVALILYLVIKTMILKRKREFGILKALGYTTFQLMTQIALSFVPIVIAGVIIGGVLGCLYTNSMLTLLLSGAGIHNVAFIVNIPLILVLCIGLIVLAYLVSMFVSRGIKRISAYGLIKE